MEMLELELQRIVSLRHRYEARHGLKPTDMTPRRRLLLDVAGELWRQLNDARNPR